MNAFQLAENINEILSAMPDLDNPDGVDDEAYMVWLKELTDAADSAGDKVLAIGFVIESLLSQTDVLKANIELMRGNIARNAKKIDRLRDSQRMLVRVTQLATGQDKVKTPDGSWVKVSERDYSKVVPIEDEEVATSSLPPSMLRVTYKADKKELRLKFDKDMTGTNIYYPSATDIGTGNGGWGAGLTYDYTKVVFDDPGAAGTDITQTMCVLGNTSADVSSDNFLPVVDNWYKWRHSFTPAADADDIQDNVFSYVIQQSSTSDQIINMIDDSQDEKPYDLTEFANTVMTTIVGTAVGNPTSAVICAPLGLLKVLTADEGASSNATWEIEVLGVVEL